MKEKIKSIIDFLIMKPSQELDEESSVMNSLYSGKNKKIEPNKERKQEGGDWADKKKSGAADGFREASDESETKGNDLSLKSGEVQEPKENIENFIFESPREVLLGKLHPIIFTWEPSHRLTWDTLPGYKVNKSQAIGYACRHNKNRVINAPETGRFFICCDDNEYISEGLGLGYIEGSEEADCNQINKFVAITVPLICANEQWKIMWMKTPGDVVNEGEHIARLCCPEGRRSTFLVKSKFPGKLYLGSTEEVRQEVIGFLEVLSSRIDTQSEWKKIEENKSNIDILLKENNLIKEEMVRKIQWANNILNEKKELELLKLYFGGRERFFAEREQYLIETYGTNPEFLEKAHSFPKIEVPRTLSLKKLIPIIVNSGQPSFKLKWLWKQDGLRVWRGQPLIHGISQERNTKDMTIYSPVEGRLFRCCKDDSYIHKMWSIQILGYIETNDYAIKNEPKVYPLYVSHQLFSKGDSDVLLISNPGYVREGDLILSFKNTQKPREIISCFAPCFGDFVCRGEIGDNGLFGYIGENSETGNTEFPDLDVIGYVPYRTNNWDIAWENYSLTLEKALKYFRESSARMKQAEEIERISKERETDVDTKHQEALAYLDEIHSTEQEINCREKNVASREREFQELENTWRSDVARESKNLKNQYDKKWKELKSHENQVHQKEADINRRESLVKKSEKEMADMRMREDQVKSSAEVQIKRLQIAEQEKKRRDLLRVEELKKQNTLKSYGVNDYLDIFIEKLSDLENAIFLSGETQQKALMLYENMNSAFERLELVPLEKQRKVSAFAANAHEAQIIIELYGEKIKSEQNGDNDEEVIQHYKELRDEALSVLKRQYSG